MHLCHVVMWYHAVVSNGDVASCRAVTLVCRCPGLLRLCHGFPSLFASRSFLYPRMLRFGFLFRFCSFLVRLFLYVRTLLFFRTFEMLFHCSCVDFFLCSFSPFCLPILVMFLFAPWTPVMSTCLRFVLSGANEDKAANAESGVGRG